LGKVWDKELRGDVLSIMLGPSIGDDAEVVIDRRMGCYWTMAAALEAKGCTPDAEGSPTRSRDEGLDCPILET